MSILSDVLPKLFVTPFTLQSIDGFPYREWSAQNERYDEYRSWYHGEPLKEFVEDKESGKRVEKYPIKINPLKNTCQKHASVLFGLTTDSIRLSTVPLKIQPNSKDKKVRESASELLEKIYEILEDSKAGTKFLENAIKAQYLGGCVFSVRWRLDELGKRIEVMNPSADEFICIPDGGDWFVMREAWVIREIQFSEARSYVPELNDDQNMYYYIEHWTPKEYSVMINDIVVKDVDGNEMRGKNPISMVPFVYIPHIRDDGFYGSSLINDTVMGLIKEMNLRWADVGDAVSNDSHDFLIGRNITASVKPVRLGEGRHYYDLGSASGLGEKADPPEIKSVSSKSASETMLKFGGELMDMYRREVQHPAVADGEDEGSQRSSLTLNTRMWPLVAHIELERLMWTVGLLVLVKIIIRFMVAKGLAEQSANDFRFRIEWPPMLSRDREALINELSTRKASNLGSLRHLLGMIDDIQYPDEMLEEIFAEQERLAKMNQTETPDGDGEKGKGKKEEKKTPSLASRSEKSSVARIDGKE